MVYLVCYIHCIYSRWILWPRFLHPYRYNSRNIPNEKYIYYGYYILNVMYTFQMDSSTTYQTTTNRNKVIQNTFKKIHLQILAVSIMHFCFFLVVILYLISQQPIICITRNIIQKDPLKENNIHNLKDPFLILRRCPNLPCQYKNDPEFRHLCPQLSTSVSYTHLTLPTICSV